MGLGNTCKSGCLTCAVWLDISELLLSACFEEMPAGPAPGKARQPFTRASASPRQQPSTGLGCERLAGSLLLPGSQSGLGLALGGYRGQRSPLPLAGGGPLLCCRGDARAMPLFVGLGAPDCREGAWSTHNAFEFV